MLGTGLTGQPVSCRTVRQPMIHIMTMNSMDHNAPEGGLGRRSVVAGAVWSAPLVLTGVNAPAVTSSVQIDLDVTLQTPGVARGGAEPPDPITITVNNVGLAPTHGGLNSVTFSDDNVSSHDLCLPLNPLRPDLNPLRPDRRVNAVS